MLGSVFQSPKSPSECWENYCTPTRPRPKRPSGKPCSPLVTPEVCRVIIGLACPMRILLAHNSLYYPSFGGGDRSNRLLMEALAARGHEVRVVARVQHFGAHDHVKLLRELDKRNIIYVEEGASV